MADESTVTIAHKYLDDAGVELVNFGVADFVSDCATDTPLHRVQSVATTEAALNLAGLTAAGALFIGKNLDETNYLEIRTGTGASNDAVKLLAGEACCFRFGSDITAPYVIANTAACLLEYRIVPA
jgi:hypothetical protein